MSSNKDDDKNIELTDQEKASNLPEDWSPDHFPTSAKPIFKKVSILTVGILTLCLFLAYCSQNDVDTKKGTENSKKIEAGSPENSDEENGEDDVF
jgi:hypothetical protein